MLRLVRAENRLGKLKAGERRMAMEMAASYKSEQLRRKSETEERAKEAASTLRKLRESTKARMARQKVRCSC